MKRDPSDAPLKHLGVKIPQRMMDAIDEVQTRNNLLTQSEAVRLVLVRGLGALGIDLSRIADAEAS